MPSCGTCRYGYGFGSGLDCPDGCNDCDKWEESDESKLKRFGEMEARLAICEDLLIAIGNFAHDRSTGPALLDDLWEVRRMAYEL